mgnify:CR=1 FL=1
MRAATRRDEPIVAEHAALAWGGTLLHEGERARFRSLGARVGDRALFGGVLVLTMLAPWLYGADHAGALLMLGWGVAALLLLWLATLAVAGEGRWTWSGGHTWMGLLLGLVVFQLVPLPVSVERLPLPEGEVLSWNRLTRDPAATAAAATQLALVWAYFILVTLSTHSLARMRALEVALLGNGAALALLGIVNALSWTGPILWTFAPDSPSFGPYANRAHFSTLMAMLLPLGLARGLSEGASQRGERALLVVALALMVAAVGVAASRAGVVLILMSGIVVPLVMGRGGGRRVLGRACLILALAIGLGIGIGGEKLGERVIGRFRDDAIAVRSEIWRTTLRMIAEHPAFGVGLGAFATMYPHYDSSNGLRRTAEAHNDYLQLLAETGIAGGLIGLGFLLFLVRSMRRALSRTAGTPQWSLAVGASVGIAAGLLHSLVDFGLQITANALVFLSLVAVLLRLGRER